MSKFRNVTGIILAGGENKRFPYAKGLIVTEGKTIIDRNIEVLSQLCADVCISTNSPTLYFNKKKRLIGDIINTRGPISGILSCLVNVQTEYIFVTACDMPFIKKELADLILSKSEGSSYDSIAPIFNNRIEPLLALYSKSVIPCLEKYIKENNKKLYSIFNDINVKYIYYDEFKHIDSSGVSFININTINDLEQAKIIACR
ncbi:molybdopterin-guanine dinucleotide biosynthesis protein A [Candidatus Magnetoovum chiemensis]|nr:molybdopterin-guanine dinucleotide biosynthesis protein A [Candidatus Magnetoovum chiemensis]